MGSSSSTSNTSGSNGWSGSERLVALGLEHLDAHGRGRLLGLGLDNLDLLSSISNRLGHRPHVRQAFATGS